jgi:regulator of protease activity HflC (stomatin/prohibitin superfamily)
MARNHIFGDDAGATPALPDRPWWQDARKLGLYVALPLVLLFLLTRCMKLIGPGHVGIVVDLYGKDKGVQNMPIVTGMNFYNPISTMIFEYPTFVQTAVWTRNPNEGGPANEEISFSSKEGLVITGDVSLSYQLMADRVPAFYVKFRSDSLSMFTHGFLRNVARDAFNEESVGYTVEELYSTKKEEYLGRVKDRMNKEVSAFGVEVQQFGFIGAPRLPQNVVDSINSKIKAIQDAIRVENELRAVEAEAKKKIAEAEGVAKANVAIQQSVNPTVLEWKRMEIQRTAVEKWNGQLPTYSGVEGTPFFPLPGK